MFLDRTGLTLFALHQGLAEPEFYGDLNTNSKKNMGKTDILISLEKLYVANILATMRQSAYLAPFEMCRF